MSSLDPYVSVVIPTYKLAHCLPRTLASVIAQTLSTWEAVVVDDGSPDDVVGACAPFVQQDSRIRYVRQANAGLPAARNFGFRCCHPASRYVMFLDADDLLRPEAMEKMCAHLDAHPESGMVHCPAQYIDADGQMIAGMEWPRGWALGPRRLGIQEKLTPFEAIYSLTEGIICSVTVMRRSIYELVGGFNEELGYPREDTNVFLEVALRSEVHRLPNKLVHYRCHSGQMSEDREGLSRQAERLYRHWATKRLSPDRKAVVTVAEAFRTSPELAFALRLEGARSLWQKRRHALALRVLGGAIRKRLGICLKSG